MRKLFTFLLLMATFCVAFAQTQYRMFVHEGSGYSADAMTTEIQQMVVNQNKIDIQTLNGTYSVQINYIDSITFHDVEEGMLPGEFSVSPSKKVCFSKGNLQFNAVKNQWRFADKQYIYMDYSNRWIDEYYDGWIDLFGWGTSGWKNGGEYYHPWDHTNDNTFAKLFGPYGEYNLTGDYAYCDWGLYNCVTNGAVMTDRWRTLLNEEWVYIFEGRANAYNLRGNANVCGSNGFILLPDNWSAPSGINFTPNASNYTTNVYNENQWDTMEAAGAVFLPAGGARSDVEMVDLGEIGFYWSTSYYNINMAYSFYFDSSMANPSYFYSFRHFGFAVRPVIDL